MIPLDLHALFLALQAPSQPWWLGPLALLFLVAFAASGFFLWRRRRRHDQRDDFDDDAALPPLIFPPRSVPPSAGTLPAGSADVSPAAPALDETETDAEGNAGRETEPGPDSEPDRPAEPGHTRPSTTTPEPPTQDEAADSIQLAPTPIRFSLHAEQAAQSHGLTAPPTEPAAGEEPVDITPIPAAAGPVRFHRAPEGTLQLLPGRLEVLDETAAAHEIRFVRPAGRDPVITFGRTTGEPLAHVQLDAPTVSRLHARMHFHDGTWHIVNLSQTNPVIVNGTRLNGHAAAEGTTLADGDRVEMGEVTFRFRMP